MAITWINFTCRNICGNAVNTASSSSNPNVRVISVIPTNQNGWSAFTSWQRSYKYMVTRYWNTVQVIYLGEAEKTWLKMRLIKLSFILWTWAHIFWFFCNTVYKNIFLVDINNCRKFHNLSLVDINSCRKFHNLSLVFTPVGFQNLSSISIWKFKVTIVGYYKQWITQSCTIYRYSWQIYKQPVIADVYHCKPFVNTHIFILRKLNRITSCRQN